MCYVEPSPTKGSQSTADNEMDTAIYAGAAAAGVLLIIGVIVIIILWKRRKVSSRENGKVSLRFLTVHSYLKFSLSTGLVGQNRCLKSPLVRLVSESHYLTKKTFLPCLIEETQCTHWKLIDVFL